MDTVARLPGITFQTQAPQPRAVLPRMDIAALVGFAASGPLNTPVAVEDPARYRELFGPDPMLAWDGERGEPVTARLGGAVEAFFRQGGRRCWVVRVAGPGIERRRFPLTGLVAAGIDRIDPAAEPWLLTEARSPGSWADTLTVEPLLQRQRLVSRNVGFSDGNYGLDLTAPPPDLSPGDLLEITLEPGQPVLWLFVTALQRQAAVTRVTGRQGYWYQPETSSPAQEPPPWQRLTDQQGLAAWAGSPAPEPTVYRLQLELRVKGSDRDWRLGELAFHPDHPRYWGHLPSDEVLFALHQGRHPPQRSPRLQELYRQADAPRFPLAGTADPEPCLPVTLGSVAGEGRGPLDGAADGDGLDAFSADLFLDPRLKGSGSGALLGEAEGRYYLQQQPLAGLHSLLPVEEITLVAIPEAGHLPWDRRAPPSGDYLPAPRLAPLPARPDVEDHYRLSWSPVAGATTYQLQQDTDPDFGRPVTVTVEPGEEELAFDPHTPPPTTVRVALSGDCPALRYFRVRARRFGQTSPWSGTRGRVLPITVFDPCRATPILELALTRTGEDDSGVELAWQSLNSSPLSSPPLDEPDYLLQEAADGQFVAVLAETLLESTTVTVPRPLDGARFYRVRRHPDGPWSNTLVIDPRARSAFTLLAVADYPPDHLLALHRALLRFCAARGDLLACLSLPRHFRSRQIRDYLAALLPGGGSTTVGVPPLTFGEGAVPGYGALYHPWPAWQPREGDPERTSFAFGPPDGFILGRMARQALEQGAWQAPANQPLTGVIALDPAFDRQDWGLLTAAQVNLLLPDSRGFLVLNADTLAPRGEYRPITVRRLLILLRRLALTEGRSYVFEPNSPGFRGRVRHRFERLLGQLYVRGAFAGPRPEAAFRVVVDDSVNPPTGIEAGRLIVELRITPARALAFLTVRLTQTGPDQLRVQEG